MAVFGAMLLGLALNSSQEPIILERPSEHDQYHWETSAQEIATGIAEWGYGAFYDLAAYPTNSEAFIEEARQHYTKRRDQLTAYSHTLADLSEQTNHSSLSPDLVELIIGLLEQQYANAVSLSEAEADLYFRHDDLTSETDGQARINAIFLNVYATETASNQAAIALNDGAISLMDCDVEPLCIEVELNSELLRFYSAYMALAADVYNGQANIPNGRGGEALLASADALALRTESTRNDLPSFENSDPLELELTLENIESFQAIAEEIRQHTQPNGDMSRGEYVYSLVPMMEAVSRHHESILANQSRFPNWR